MTKCLRIGLYAVGVVFMVLAGMVWYGATSMPDKERQFLVVNEPFEYEALRSPNGFRSYRPPTIRRPSQRVTILTMPADPCTDCLSEVYAYLAWFEQDGPHGRPVPSDIVVVGDDRGAAKRFANAIHFHLGGLDLYPESVRI